MKLVINGKPHDFDGARTIADLLRELKLSPKGLAVETNGALVSARRFEDQPLEEGDRLELVRLVGGG